MSMKVEGPLPSLRERPFVHRAPLPFREEAVCFAYIAVTVLFPTSISPTSIRRRDEMRPRRSWAV